MTIEVFVAGEDPGAGGRSSAREDVRVDCNGLVASNIRFDATARRCQPLDPRLEETIANPVWSSERAM